MEESALIAAAKRGDREAFNDLVIQYQSIAYNVAYRILGNVDAAADATQEAFLSAFKAVSQFRGGSFKSWLLRIVTNACYDELRRQKRRPTVSLQPMGADEDEIESPVWLEDPGETPEETALREELSSAIQNCLDSLDDDFRIVVVLVDIQGMDYAEAAESTNAPLGTIKSRLARARMRLQDCLRGFGELLPAVFRLDGERIS